MESKVGRGIGKTISLAQHICDVINKGKMCSIIAEGRFTEVAPIVRCKDCKKCTEMQVHKTHWCNGPKKGPTKPNGFCDEGER